MVTLSAATTTTRRQRPALDPVLRHREGLGGAGARRVQLGVRAAGADDLRELRVTHGEDPEQETAIEHVRVSLDLGLQGGDAAVELGHRGRGSAAVRAHHAGPHRLAGRPTARVGPCPCSTRGHSRRRRRCPGKADAKMTAGVVAQVVGQAPPLGQPGSEVGGLVVLDQRDAGVVEGIEAGRDRHARRSLEGRGPIGVDAELADRVERLGPGRELDDIGSVVDGLEAAAPVDRLTSRVMCWSTMASRISAGMALMNCSPCSRRPRLDGSNRCSVPGRPDGRAGHDDRPSRSPNDRNPPSPAVRSTNWPPSGRVRRTDPGG